MEFELVDAGSAGAGSRVGAGILNPLTGPRLAESWRLGPCREVALRVYGRVEGLLGERLAQPMRVRRRLGSGEERAIFEAKWGRGALAGHVREQADEGGCWVEGAWRVDTARLVVLAGERWRRQGRLREGRLTVAEIEARGAAGGVVVLCTGAEGNPGGRWPQMTRAWGDLLEVETAGLTPGVILNGGSWVVPEGDGRGLAGATYVREGEEGSGAERLEGLERATGVLLEGRAWRVSGRRGGWRAATATRRPVAAWGPGMPGVGVLTGLGSKGVLYAPWLAEGWARTLKDGVALPVEAGWV